MKTFNVNNIQLKMQSPSVRISSDLLNYIISHIEKLGNTYSRIKKCELIFKNENDSQNNNCVAEIKLFVPQNVIFAKDHCNNFRLAFKNVFDDLYEQLKKIKEKSA